MVTAIGESVQQFYNKTILDVLEKISVSYCKLKNSGHEFELVNEMDDQKKQLYEVLNLRDKNTFSYIKRAF